MVFVSMSSDSLIFILDVNVERKGSKLNWRINDLVMFVDKQDVARIPVELYKRVCEIEAPGCPGPQYKAYVKATKYLSFMVLFLLFILGE